MIKLTVNGTEHALDLEPNMPLLWAIREHGGLTGTKYGCGIAQCGACTGHESFKTYVAQVAEVTARKSGAFRVDRVVVAVDCGVPVSPDVIRGQGIGAFAL
jgi:CO/xanthine dehydrogenase Mo-binding subunit